MYFVLPNLQASYTKIDISDCFTVNEHFKKWFKPLFLIILYN